MKFNIILILIYIIFIKENYLNNKFKYRDQKNKI